ITGAFSISSGDKNCSRGRRRRRFLSSAFHRRDGGRSSATPGSRASPLQDRRRRNRFVGGTINFEKCTADFGQTFLNKSQVLMQAVFEDVTYRSEIEIVT